MNIRIIYQAITLTAALMCCGQSWAQRHAQTEIIGDVAVTQLVEKHIEFNERVKTVPGFRIQIASLSGANSKAAAFALKNKFKELYPEVEAYLVFDEPNFKVKVGDFITKLDAYVFQQKIKPTFNGNIIKDHIYPIRLEWDDLVPETDEDAEN